MACALPGNRFALTNSSFAIFLFDKHGYICYIYNRGANQLCAKVKINAGKETMSKIIRLNNETCRLIELIRLDLKKEFANNEMLESMKDVLDNDNLIIQSGLRTAIEFNTYLVAKSK